MKKWVSILLFCLCSASLFGQIGLSISGSANAKIIPVQGDPIEIGMKLTLKEFKRSSFSPTSFKDAFYADCEGRQVAISPDSIKSITFDDPTSREALWELIALSSDLYRNLASKGYQYDIRRDLEDDTLDLLSNFKKFGWLFEDEYLEDYLQSLLYKIHPVTLKDGRPGNLIIRVLKNNMPNAFSTATGTIIVTTGLLSSIRSEDELIGILAHETAHFALDHQVVNINIASARKKRAEFWAGIASTIAAAAEVYLAAKNNVDTGGYLTYSVAVLSTSIADSILERLGAKFNREQETEADTAAAKSLAFLKRDPKALSAALTRIQTYCVLNGDYLALSPSGTHPALSQRIREIGKVDPELFNSSNYDQLISFVNTYNAGNEYGLKHLETTLQLVNRNIEAGVATEEDYLLKGMVMRALFDTPERNQEALANIVRAKTLNINPDYYPQIHKEEGITLLRLGRKQEAIGAFQLYLQKLEETKDKPQYVLDEIAWTRKMIFKTRST